MLSPLGMPWINLWSLSCTTYLIWIVWRVPIRFQLKWTTQRKSTISLIAFRMRKELRLSEWWITFWPLKCFETASLIIWQTSESVIKGIQIELLTTLKTPLQNLRCRWTGWTLGLPHWSWPLGKGASSKRHCQGYYGHLDIANWISCAKCPS